jgi:hypothetical protein
VGGGGASVADPGPFFTIPDPGIFFQSRSRQKKTYFFKGNNKILGEIFVFNPISRYFIFFSNNQSGFL